MIRVHVATWFVALCMSLGGALRPEPVEAKPIGADAPCFECCKMSSYDVPSGKGPCPDISGGSFVSSTNGTMGEVYPVVRARSANGAGLELSLHYTSYMGDGDKAALNTVLGFGWSHSYNIFVFAQGSDLFKASPGGLVTKYKRSLRGGSLAATRGAQQTIVQNADGSLEIRNNQGGSTYRFEKIPGNPIRVEGAAPWMLKRITDRVGNETRLTYKDGRLETVEDTYGRQIKLEYDDRHRITAITDPLSRITRLTYDGYYNLASIQDPLEDPQFVRYSYNELHQIVAKVDKNGKRWTYLYNAARKPIGITDPSGKRVFDLTNPDQWATDPDELFLIQQREYKPSTTTRRDGRGNLWTYQYDLNGYLTVVKAPDGATTTYTYDDVLDPDNGKYATLNVATETDANGNPTGYAYDAKGNRVRMTDALGHVTTYEYEPVFNHVTRITYPNSSSTEYQYDSLGNRIQETRDVDGLELLKSWTYDAKGNVVSESVRNINAAGETTQTTSYSYDDFGNLASVTDPEGHVTKYENDIIGNRVAETDGNGNTTVYFFDELDRLTLTRDPLGFTTEYAYDGNDNRIEVKRQVDATRYQLTKYVYDLRNRLTQEIRLNGTETLVTRYTYDGNNNRTSVTDPRGKVTTFSYDTQNRLTQVKDALGNLTRTLYDDVGNRIRVIDANVRYTYFEYDALNRMTKEIRKIGDISPTPDANDLVTQNSYDTGAQISFGDCQEPQCGEPIPGSSNVARVIDPELKYTYFKYDKVNRRVMTIRKVGDIADTKDADDWAETLRLDSVGNVLRQTDANGNATTHAYDRDNLKTSDANALNETTQYTYDAAHNLTHVTAPNGNTTQNTYNARNELISVSDSVGRVADYSYDGVGNRVLELDGNFIATRYTYDLVNRLIAVIDPLNNVTQYAYDAANNLIRITDREGRSTCHVYDAINRRTLTLQKMGGTECVYEAPDIWTATEYDKVGNVKRLLTAKHNGAVTPPSCAGSTPNPTQCEVTRYAYDEVNRLKTETYPDGKSRSFTYDRASNLKTRKDQLGVVTTYHYNDLYYLTSRVYPSGTDTFGYDTGGRMLTALRAGWANGFAYDAANRVKQAVQNGKSVLYTYDIPGRKRTVVYPGGRTIVEATDRRSRLEQIVNGGSTTPVVTYLYDLGNRVNARSYANGTSADYVYNPNNWITALDHKKGATLIAGFRHEYDKEGNKRFEKNLHQPGRSEGYQYDPAYRLIDYKVGNLVGATVPSPITQTQYDLDKLGNWDSKTVSPGTTETRTHDTVNQITSINGVPLKHDLKGNLIEDARYRYAYDEENRLTKVTRKSDGRVMGQYRYDALSRRVAKIAQPNGTLSETRYFYDDARIVEEQTTAGATQATYVYGNYIDEVLNMQRGGQDYYYHQNALWSVAAVTNAAGAVVERYSYDAYGFPTITDGSGVQVPVWDVDRPRSAIGNPWMFTGREWDEESGLYYYRARYYDPGKGRFLQRDSLEYIDGMSLHQYVSSNPINRTDPTGKVWPVLALCAANPELCIAIVTAVGYGVYKAGSWIYEKSCDWWCKMSIISSSCRESAYGVGQFICYGCQGKQDCPQNDVAMLVADLPIEKATVVREVEKKDTCAISLRATHKDCETECKPRVKFDRYIPVIEDRLKAPNPGGQ